MVVLGVRAEVLGELVDPLGQQRDLDPGVPGVLAVGAELLGELGLSLLRQGHAVREGSSARTASTSCAICPIRASTDGKRRSPRRRLRNLIGRSWPYRSPSKWSRYASMSSPRPVGNWGRTPTLTAAGRPPAQAA